MKNVRRILYGSWESSSHQRVPGLILTEDDLKCHLFKRLIDLPALAESTESVDSGRKRQKVQAPFALWPKWPAYKQELNKTILGDVDWN